MYFSQAISIRDLTAVGEARRAAQRISLKLGFDEVKAGEMGIIVTEAARNVMVHGGGGTVVLSSYGGPESPRIDLLALDNGRGIKDISKAMADGYSTAATPGTGLGAMRRIAEVFDLFSNPQGTALLARVGAKASRPGNVDYAFILAPIAGEKVCGDGFDLHQIEDRTQVLLVDGLGHGPDAHDAAEEASAAFAKHQGKPPAVIMDFIHHALRKTRGAAGVVAEFSLKTRSLKFCGVGNISAVAVNAGGNRSLVSHNGTLGHVAPRIHEFVSEWHTDSSLIIHSDGVSARWDLSKYPGLLKRDPAMIAGVLYRDFHRQRDDAGIVVLRNHAEAAA